MLKRAVLLLVLSAIGCLLLGGFLIFAFSHSIFQFIYIYFKDDDLKFLAQIGIAILFLGVVGVSFAIGGVSCAREAHNLFLQNEDSIRDGHPSPHFQNAASLLAFSAIFFLFICGVLILSSISDLVDFIHSAISNKIDIRFHMLMTGMIFLGLGVPFAIGGVSCATEAGNLLNLQNEYSIRNSPPSPNLHLQVAVELQDVQEDFVANDNRLEAVHDQQVCAGLRETRGAFPVSVFSLISAQPCPPTADHPSRHSFAASEDAATTNCSTAAGSGYFASQTLSSGGSRSSMTSSEDDAKKVSQEDNENISFDAFPDFGTFDGSRQLRP